MIRLYQSQHEVIIELIEHSSALEERLGSLERKQSKNSRNSSKPPSTDQVKVKRRSRSLREKSDRPVGGQIGHEGHTLERVSNPDHTELHQVHECSLCGKSLDEVQPIDLERRQVFDLPPMKIEVTEHQSEKKICPRCGCLNQASFPVGVDQAAQYGNRLKSTAVYLNQYQFIPYDRLSGLFDDLFNHKPSQATLVEANRLCYEMVEPAEKAIKAELIKSKVVHFDESGMRIEGLRQWIHVACTSSLTYYAAHPSRGSEANVAMGILPEFKGIAVHDKWRSYYKFDCQHALCNGHHLRDLNAISELDGQVWPNDMKQLLLEIKKVADERRPTESWFDHDEIGRFEKRYDQMIQMGMLENPPPDPILNPDPPKKRGPKKQTPAKNLLDSLTKCKSQVLAFMYNPLVPFDNNQAERDIRMMKVQQKISGTFRSKAGADMFCRIRGYISTARKNGVSVIDAIIGAFEGRPFMPPSATL
jgi:transposase